jgi:hypothetical protein
VARAPSWGTLSKLAFTALASSGVPSLKVTPLRRVNVYAVASALTCHFVASHGTIAPVAGSWSVSESTIWRRE